MDFGELEKIWAVAGTIGIITLTWYRSAKNTQQRVQDAIDEPPENISLIGQSLEISAIQTGMLQKLLDRATENEKQIDSMAVQLSKQTEQNEIMRTRLNDLELRNKELETFKNLQAAQIDRLKSRVEQLEAELKKNDLKIPEPLSKRQKDDNDAS